MSVPAAGTYDVTFHNTGAIPHDITFADGTKIPAAAGATETGTVSIPEAGFAFICSIPGHEQAGMKGAVTVAGTATSAEPGKARRAIAIERRRRGPQRSCASHL